MTQIQNLRHYSVSDGLPFILVSAIHQNANGELWIGGYGGLCRYDGIEFKNYGKAQGLSGYWINAIQSGHESDLWIATNNGLNSIRGEQILTPFPQILNKRITSLAYQKTEKSLYVGTESGIYRVKEDTISLISSTQREVSTISAYQEGTIFYTVGKHLLSFSNNRIDTCDLHVATQFYVSDAYISSNDIIYLAANKGVIAYDLKNKKSVTYGIKEGLPSPVCHSIVEKDSTIYVGTNYGLVKIRNEQLTTELISANKKDNQVQTLFVDNEEGLWLGTNNGIYQKTRSIFKGFQYSDGIPEASFYQIIQDSLNNYWIGTSAEGVFKYNGEYFINYSQKHGLPSNTVTTICNYKGTVYFGTSKGLCKLEKGKFVHVDLATPESNINALFVDKKNQLWIGGTTTLTRYTAKETEYWTLPLSKTSRIRAITESSEGKILIGAYEEGIFELGDSLVNLSESIDILDFNVLNLLYDNADNLWIGTFEGVYVVKKDSSIFHLDQSAGLNSNLVYSMLKAPDSSIWVGTNQGLNRINYHSSDLKDVSIRTYGIEDGFEGVECNVHGLWNDHENKLWIGSVSGLFAVRPERLKTQKEKLHPLITGIELFYTDTVVSENHLFPSDQNHIGFNFKEVSLSAPHQVAYTYRLRGFNKNKWSPYTKERKATFSNLPAGKYTFEVKSIGQNGTVSDQTANFTFKVEQVWYKKIWIIGIFSLSTIALVTVVIRKRINNIKIRADLSNTLEKFKLQALRSQMNPHFIFNSLNSIQYYINSNEKRAANKYLSLFSSLMRKVMENSRSDYVLLKDDLDALKNYLELELMRFEEGFTYSITIQDEIDTEFVSIPPLLIQPFVENSIIHGFKHLEIKGHIAIRIALRNNHIVCEIEDNGIGREQSKLRNDQQSEHKSAGLGITQSRIETLTHQKNQEHKVIIEDLYNDGKPSGTRVLITLPNQH